MGIFQELCKEERYIEDHSNDIIGSGWLVNTKKDKTMLKERYSNNIWVTGPNKVLKKQLLQAIDSAKEVVCICSFLFAEDDIEQAIINAFERGVRVYLLTARDEILENQSEDLREFDLKVKEKHIEMLKNFSGKILVRKGSHFHSKFILIDPNNEQMRRGFLLTSNLTKKALEVNPEIGLELDNITSLGLFLQFKQGFWNESERELIQDELIPIESQNQIIPQMTSKLLSTSKVSTSLKENLLSLIKSTSGEIIISTFGIADDCDITKAIFDAAKNNRKITLITQTRKATMEIANRLQEIGVKIVGHKDVHAKVILVKETTGPIGILMTANINSQGLDFGFETGIKLEGNNAKIMKTILEDWIDRFPAYFEGEIKLKDIDDDKRLFTDRVGRTLILRENVLSTNITVEKKYQKDFGYIFSPTIDRMPNTRPKNFPKPNEKRKFYKEYMYTWIIAPPVLPSDVKEVKNIDNKEKKGFKIYRKKNQLFLLLENIKDKSKAEKVSKKYKAIIVVEEE